MNGGQSQQDRITIHVDKAARHDPHGTARLIGEMAKAQAECLAMIAFLKGLSGQETRA